MRKITQQAARAFFAGENFHGSNTEVRTYFGGLVQLFLFNNMIAQYSKHGNREITFTLHGWNTNTTRERLAGLGIKITTKKGQAYFEGVPIDENKFYNSGIIA